MPRALKALHGIPHKTERQHDTPDEINAAQPLCTRRALVVMNCPDHRKPGGADNPEQDEEHGRQLHHADL